MGEMIGHTENNVNDMVRKSIIFFGQVQGVGFRYRAAHAAGMLRLTGWVRNEWDGTVAMEVQGTQSAIERMIRIINQGRFVDIRQIKVTSLPLEQHENGFHIR